MAPVLAHFGHWYVSLPIYFGPPTLLGIYLKWSGRREQRRRRDAGERLGSDGAEP
ncbi:MAG: hypothetical protein NVSMB25_02110 [Thermoleophilaceae bacterium]